MVVLAWFAAVLTGLVLLLALACLALQLGLANRAVAGLIARRASSLAGVPVSLKVAAISPLSARIALADVRIGNPPGYRAEAALACPEIEAALDPASLLPLVDGPVVIRSLLVRDPVLDLEARRDENNLKALMATARTTPAAGGRSGTLFVIDHMAMTRGTLRLGLAALGPGRLDVPFPGLELWNLGSEQDGLPPEDIAREIFKAAVDEAMATAAAAVERFARDKARALKDTLKESLKDRLRGFLSR